MTFHGRMVNIPTDSVQMLAAAEPGTPEELAYKFGHRDARHAAAEIGLEMDRILADQRATFAEADQKIRELKAENADLTDNNTTLCAGIQLMEKRMEEKREWADQQGREHGESFAAIVADNDDLLARIGRLESVNGTLQAEKNEALDMLKTVADERDALAREIEDIKESF